MRVRPTVPRRARAGLLSLALALGCIDDEGAVELPLPGLDETGACFEVAGEWDDTDFVVELALADGAETHRGWVLGRRFGSADVELLRLAADGGVESTWAWPGTITPTLHGIAPGVRAGTALVDATTGPERSLSLLDANGGATPLVASTVSFDSLYTDGGALGAYTVQYAASADRTLLMLGPTAAPDLGVVLLLLELNAGMQVAEAWSLFYDPGIDSLPLAMTDMVSGRTLALPSLPLTVFPYARVLVDVDPASVEPSTITTLWIARIRGDRGTVEVVDPVVIDTGFTQGIGTTTPDVVDTAADPTTTWYLYDDTEVGGDALLVAIDDIRDVALLAQIDDLGATTLRLLQLSDGVALVRHLVGDDTVEITRLSRDFDPITNQVTLSGETALLDVSRTKRIEVVGLRTAGVGHLLVDYSDGRSRLQGVRCVPAVTRSAFLGSKPAGARLPQVLSSITTSTRSPGPDPS